jgi:hypothetical protein
MRQARLSQSSRKGLQLLRRPPAQRKLLQGKGRQENGQEESGEKEEIGARTATKSSAGDGQNHTSPVKWDFRLKMSQRVSRGVGYAFILGDSDSSRDVPITKGCGVFLLIQSNGIEEEQVIERRKGLC